MNDHLCLPPDQDKAEWKLSENLEATETVGAQARRIVEELEAINASEVQKRIAGFVQQVKEDVLKKARDRIRTLLIFWPRNFDSEDKDAVRKALTDQDLLLDHGTMSQLGVRW